MVPIRWSYSTVYDYSRRYTTVYGDRIAPYTEKRISLFFYSVFSHGLRIWNPFLNVSLRIRVSYTDLVYDLRISPFLSVDGRLRACMFDLGRCSKKTSKNGA